MRAVVITAPHSASVQRIARWLPGPDDILVRTRAAAVCTTDRQFFSGARAAYPAIGGHEVSGVVEWVREGHERLAPGDPVALDAVRRCGVCRYCVSGAGNLCIEMSKSKRPNGFAVIGGGFAEYVCLPSASAVKLSPGADLAEAALIEPLACCLRSIEKAAIRPGDSVLIFGAGTMGRIHQLLALRRGGIVIACDVDPYRLEDARRLGAHHTVPAGDGAARTIRELTGGAGADVVILAAGSRDAGRLALDVAGRLARVVFYASLQPSGPVDLDWNRVHYAELVITGAFSKTRREFEEAARMVELGTIRTRDLIERTIPLEALPEELGKPPPAGRVIVQL